MRTRCSGVLRGSVSAFCICVAAGGVGKSDINRLLRRKKSLVSCALSDKHRDEVRSFGGRLCGKINSGHFSAPSCPHTLLWHRAQVCCLHEVARSIQGALKSLRHPPQRTCRRSVPSWLSSWRPEGTPRDISGDTGHLYLGNKATFTA